jgi:mevalonate pyrophosphate decarboxylase
MAVLRLDRRTAGSAGTGESATPHAALAAAVKNAFPRLQAQLAKAGNQA